MSKFPFPTSENLEDALVEKNKTVSPEPSEDALDHGVEESFPASDPVSVSITKVIGNDSASTQTVEVVEPVEVIEKRLKEQPKK